MPNWIRVDTNVTRHRKTRRLMSLLKITEPRDALSLLVSFWLAVADECPDGVLEGWDPADIAHAAGWTGDADELVHALVHCGGTKGRGYLSIGAEGTLHLVSWEDYNGKRVLAAFRQRRHRHKLEIISNA